MAQYTVYLTTTEDADGLVYSQDTVVSYRSGDAEFEHLRFERLANGDMAEVASVITEHTLWIETLLDSDPHVISYRRLPDVTGTLAHVLETEDAATLETHGYVVNVCEGSFYEGPDCIGEYELNVCQGGMPPHASHMFPTLDAVQSYLATGEVLDVTADDTRWQSVTE